MRFDAAMSRASVKDATCLAIRTGFSAQTHQRILLLRRSSRAATSPDAPRFFTQPFLQALVCPYSNATRGNIDADSRLSEYGTACRCAGGSTSKMHEQDRRRSNCITLLRSGQGIFFGRLYMALRGRERASRKCAPPRVLRFSWNQGNGWRE